MKYYDIIANLHRVGHPPAKVAESLGVSRAIVSEVIHGKKASYNVASYIASVTSIPLSRLFPDGRYNKPPKTNARRAAHLTSAKGRVAA